MSALHHTNNAIAQPDEHSCGCDHACNASAKAPVGTENQQSARPGQLLLRVPAMDCPTEEGQIRRALEAFPDARRLSFDLAGRTLSIDAPSEAWPDIQSAIKKAGFDSERLSAPPSVDTATQLRNQFLLPIAALVVAVVAEAVAYVTPETLVWKLVGMGIAGVAIALSGLRSSRRGWQLSCAGNSISTP